MDLADQDGCFHRAELTRIHPYGDGLHGASSDARLISGRYGGVAGVRIDALLPAAEAIGFVQGATLASLNLASAAQFVFV